MDFSIALPLGFYWAVNDASHLRAVAVEHATDALCGTQFAAASLEKNL